MEWTYKTLSIAILLIIVIAVLGKRQLRNKKRQERELLQRKKEEENTETPKLQKRLSFRPKNPLAIPDKFTSLEEVQVSLRDSGLESSNLIIGVDYTKSNEYNGTRSFKGRSLHHMGDGVLNPYQQVISILGRTLESFDDDKHIPTFGFGKVLSFQQKNKIFI